jgi:hypothetical protein
MVVAKWTGTVAAALALASFACGQTALPPTTTVECPRVITVQELGKAAQRCRVMRTWREPDGMIAFEIQVISTGERMTLVESSGISERAGSTPGSRLRAMATRIYHWPNASAPPVGAPLAPYDAIVLRPPAGSMMASHVPGYAQGSYQTWASTQSPYTVAAPPQVSPAAPAARPVVNTQTVSRTTKPAAETAPPSDWHQSWGKADDHRARIPKTDLPHADSSKPDPLKDPENYMRRPNAFGAAPKTDSTDKKKPVPDQGSMAPRAVAKNAVLPASLPVNPKPAPATPAEAASQGTARWPVKTGSATPQGQDTIIVAKENRTVGSVFKRLFGRRPSSVQPAKPKDEVIIVVNEPVKKEKPVVIKEKVVKAPAPRGRIIKAATTKKPVVKQSPAAEEVVMVAPAAMPVPQENASPGSRSVIEAGMGPGQMVYVPVPLMTPPPLTNYGRPMPPPTPPAAPQQAQRRQAPPEEVNAFTTPPEPAPSGQPLPPEFVNAFAVPPDESQPNPASPINAGMYAVSFSGRTFPGYTMGMNPYMYMYVAQPYPMAAASRFPWSYPRTPAPTSTTVAQASYRGDAAGKSNTVLERGPGALPKRPTGPDINIAQMIDTLKNSLYPSHREWAANILTAVDWHKHPEVVTALVKAAREDPAATVRAACVRDLGKMNANTQGVIEVLQALTTDPAPQVVQEVGHTLALLNGTAKAR